MYYKDDPRYKNGHFTMFPNEALCMDLSVGEIALYLYLLFREDRKTYTCYPSGNQKKIENEAKSHPNKIVT